MKYEFAEDLQKQAEEISKMLFPHIDLSNIKCYRSYGTSSRGTIARCHALNKIMQKAIGIKAVYVLEFLTERFEKMSEEEKIKVVIHELMHIPKTFGGGFKHHDFVTDRNVNKCYAEYKKGKDKNDRKQEIFSTNKNSENFHKEKEQNEKKEDNDSRWW
ncbi:metallopeptidase [Candidatus Pacearchaeota archaeon]|nr:metallopeptidase [Candidatus Pacearchaeota archaeon]